MAWIPGWDSVAGAHWWESFFFWASIGALILLGVSEIASHRYAQRKDELAANEQTSTQRRHDEEMARLHAETEASKAEIAKANARTAEAELRLKRLEPRNLNWAEFVDALRDMPQSAVEILYFADDFDSMSLAQQIDLAIREARWSEPSRNPIEKPLSWTGPTPMAVDGQPSGVTLVARDETRRANEFSAGNMAPPSGPLTPFVAMERALLAGIGKLRTWVNGPHAPPAGTLRIVVAPRE